MPDTTIPRVPLGAPTTNRKWNIDVAPLNGAYIGLFGISDQKVKRAVATTTEDTDADGGGYKSTAVIGLEWGVEGKFNRKGVLAAPSSYDPGQELVRTAGERMGASNILRVRVYEMEENGPRVQAFEGLCAVTYDDDGGGVIDKSVVSFSLMGRGKPTDIPHPSTGAVTPTALGASPSGAAAGSAVLITGSGFTGLNGAAQVKFCGTNATKYDVLNDGQILAVVPAGSAGPIVLTVGASTIPYTRGA